MCGRERELRWKEQVKGWCMTDVFIITLCVFQCVPLCVHSQKPTLSQQKAQRQIALNIGKWTKLRSV